MRIAVSVQQNKKAIIEQAKEIRQSGNSAKVVYKKLVLSRINNTTYV